MNPLAAAPWAAVLWLGAIALVIASIVLALLARRLKTPLLGAVGVVPVSVGLLLHGFGTQVPVPYPLPALINVFVVALFALGVIAGGPITLAVLGLAERQPVVAGTHGGIVPARTDDAVAPREVLQGGATIGYLERIAVIGLTAFGMFEGVAIVVAIKGLGRFGELESPEARERFIIGTLVSLIWAGACAALIVLTR